MAVEAVIENVKEINPQRGYWFVRTDSGKYFDTYVDNNFIAIGWNEITLDSFRNLSEGEVKIRIGNIEKENIDIESSVGKSKATAIYHKIKRFTELQKGDVVVIPSRESSRLAFGVVEDTNVYIENEDLQNCEYYKRKKISWIEVESLSKLDPVFYQVKFSRHAISDISKYQNYIDNVTNSIYLKDGYVHYVLKVNTENSINLNSLLKLVTSIKELNEEINEDFNLNEDVDSSSIRLNLQSPGKIELKLKKGVTLAILAVVLSVAIAPNGNIPLDVNERQEIDSFIQIHQDTITDIQNVIIELEVDREKINSFE